MSAIHETLEDAKNELAVARVYTATDGLWRHKKTDGLYLVEGVALLEWSLQPVVIYRAVKDGTRWVRPAREFCDGRFEVVTQ